MNERVAPEECIFCRIVRGEAPAHRVFEDERALCFLDIFPVAHAIREVFAPDGIGVFQLNGAAAGQTVFHYHMHLIPRRHGEALEIHSRTPGDPERLAETARRLAVAIPAAQRP
jgi:histidine triad (HIT) family protein